MSNVILCICCMVGGLLGMMISFYLILCFICWVGDVIEKKKWRYWFKW